MVKVKVGDLVRVVTASTSRTLVSPIIIGRVRRDGSHNNDFYIHTHTQIEMFRRNISSALFDGLPLRKWYIAYNDGTSWVQYEVRVLG